MKDKVLKNKTTCRNCQFTFEFTPKDLDAWRNDEWKHSPVYVFCPFCFKETYLKKVEE